MLFLEHDRDSNRDDWLYRVLICGILLIAATVRLFGLEQHGLWYDEILTALRAQESMTWLLASEPLRNWPLHYLATKLAFLLLGQSDFTTRLPSALAGITGVVAIYWAGKAFFGRREALIAAILLALSPLHVHASRDARYYALTVLLCLITTMSLWCAVSRRGKRYWALYLLTTLLSLYNHPTALFILASQMVFLAVLSAARLAPELDRIYRHHKTSTLRSPSALYPLICIVILAAIAIGYVWTLPGEMSARLLGQGSGVSPIVNLSSPFFVDLFDALAAGPGLVSTAFGVAFVLGIITSVRDARIPALLLVTLMVIPVVVLPFLKLRIQFVYKYLIFMLPAYLLPVSRGVMALFAVIGRASLNPRISRSPLARLPGLVALIALVGYSGRGALHQIDEGQEAWREMAAFVEEHVQANEPIIVAPMIGQLNAPSRAHVFQYYQREERLLHSLEDAPDLCVRHPAIWTISAPPYTPILDLSGEEYIAAHVSSFGFYPRFRADYWMCSALP